MKRTEQDSGIWGARKAGWGGAGAVSYAMVRKSPEMESSANNCKAVKTEPHGNLG